MLPLGVDGIGGGVWYAGAHMDETGFDSNFLQYMRGTESVGHG